MASYLYGRTPFSHSARNSIDRIDLDNVFAVFALHTIYIATIQAGFRKVNIVSQNILRTIYNKAGLPVLSWRLIPSNVAKPTNVPDSIMRALVKTVMVVIS